jgi:small-conductance mechanosensitive channel
VSETVEGPAGGERLSPPDRERADRQLNELLQELRIVMPGIQLLFAFLLAVPFAPGFKEVTNFQEDVYLFTLLCAAVSSALFIAPTAYHRIVFHRGRRPDLIRFTARAALAGLVFLALSMTSAILLVTGYLFSSLTAGLVTGAVALTFGWLWFGLGFLGRENDD